MDRIEKTVVFEGFLPKAIFLSVAVHTLFVCAGYFWHMPTMVKKQRSKGVEITVKRPPTHRPDVKERPVKAMRPLDLKNTVLGVREDVSGIGLSRPASLPRSFTMVERKRPMISAAPMVHKVSVTPIKSAKINNPAYAAYNEMVRSRIEAKVYEKYQQSPQGGSVYLTFMISSDGLLKAAQILDDRSRAPTQLKDVSLRSIKDCVFPPFLKGMSLPEYTFNIEIQFQVKD